MSIKQQNDQFRRTGIGGRYMITAGVKALGQEKVNQIVRKVQTFDQFTKDNDPYEEHDYGSFVHEGEKILWKIDYYDKNLEFGSEDPADPSKTTRVLTIMTALEY